MATTSEIFQRIVNALDDAGQDELVTWAFRNKAKLTPLIEDALREKARARMAPPIDADRDAEAAHAHAEALAELLRAEGINAARAWSKPGSSARVYLPGEAGYLAVGFNGDVHTTVRGARVYAPSGLYPSQRQAVDRALKAFRATRVQAPPERIAPASPPPPDLTRGKRVLPPSAVPVQVVPGVPGRDTPRVASVVRADLGWPPEVLAALRRGIEIPDPQRPQTRRDVYRLRRFAFVTPKGYPKIPPVEVLVMRGETYKAVRGQHYPFTAMGERWVKDEILNHLGQDGQWHRGHPRVPDPRGPPREIEGDPIEGTYVEEVPCDERCVFATGKKCECACGGVNHGAGTSLVWRPRSAAQIRALIRAAPGFSGDVPDFIVQQVAGVSRLD